MSSSQEIISLREKVDQENSQPPGETLEGLALFSQGASRGETPPERPDLQGARPEDQSYMRACIKLAREAAARNEVPVGALVVHHHPETGEREVIGVGFNLREMTHDPTAHAEVVAMRRAAHRLGQWRLNECTLYVTLEPCPMCAGAIVNARVKRVVYGCNDPKAGAGRSLYSLMDDPRLNHRAELTAGVEAEQAAQVLKDFFARRRTEKRRARQARQARQEP